MDIQILVEIYMVGRMQDLGGGGTDIPISKAKGYRVYRYQSYQYSQDHSVPGSKGKGERGRY
jgi:hypothetical protein